MKKCTRYCAGPAYYRMYSKSRRLLFKTNRQPVTFKNHHPSFLRFWNWAEENCRVRQKFVAQKMLLKQKQTNINKWLSVLLL